MAFVDQYFSLAFNNIFIINVRPVCQRRVFPLATIHQRLAKAPLLLRLIYSRLDYL